MTDIYQVLTFTSPPHIRRLAKRPVIIGCPGPSYEIPDEQLFKYGYGKTPQEAIEAYKTYQNSRIERLRTDIALSEKERDLADAITDLTPVDEPAQPPMTVWSTP